MNKLHGSKLLLFLSFVFFFSLLLSIFYPLAFQTFSTSDDAGFLLAGLDFFHFFDEPSIENLIIYSFRLAAFGWGPFTIFVTVINVAFFSILNIPLSEFVLRLPFIFFGAISPIVAFFFVKRFHNEKSAVLSALLVTVLPIHIIQSVRPGGNWLIAATLLMASLYFFAEYAKSSGSRYSVITPFLIALYFLTDNQFLGIIPLLIFTSLLFQDRKNLFDRIKETFLIFSPKFFVIFFLIFSPVLLQFLYYANQGTPQYGFLGHFLEKTLSPGFYVFYILGLLKDYLGGALLLLLPFSLLTGLYSAIRLEKKSIFFIWFLVYSIPYFFLLPPSLTGPGMYLIGAAFSSTILASILLTDLFDFIRKKTNNLRIHFLSPFADFLLIIVTFSYFFTPTYVANDLENSAGRGLRTAGYFIRENFSEEVLILTDFEPSVARIYFGREPIAEYDLSLSEFRDFFNRTAEKADLIVLSETAYLNLKDELPQAQSLAAVVKRENKDLLFISSKNGKNSIQQLDVNEYDILFTEKYGNYASLYSEKIW